MPILITMKSVLWLLFYLLLLAFKSSAQQTIVLQPGPDEGEDSYLNSYYHTANGDYPNLFAIAWTHSGEYFAGRGIFRFDLTAIPPGSFILDAKLSLYYGSNSSYHQYHYGDNESFIQRVVENWEEETVTWYNQPAITQENQVRLPASTGSFQDYEDIDVTFLVQDMMVYPENSFGFLLRLGREEIYRSLMFASSDNNDPALRPKLIITYLPCQLPEAGFTFEVINDHVEFQDQSSDGESWSWDFGDGSTSDLQHPVHYYDDNGSYYVCQVVENDCGEDTACMWVDYCQETNSFYEYIDNHDVVSFLDRSENAEWWHWDFGDGSTSDLQHPVHYYDEEGFYFVCLTAGNSCGQDTYCDTIYHCTLPSAGLEYTVLPEGIIFTSTSAGADSWWWSFGDGFYSELRDPEHYYAEYGTYLVCLTVENDCGSSTFCDSVNFCQVPRAGFSCHTEGMTVYFQDESTDALSCHWDFGNGFYSVLECPEYTFEQEGLYDVCLTVKNECGSSVLCDTVRVKRAAPDVPEPYIDIYPNPASEYLRLDLPWSGRYKILMFNAIGEKMLEREIVLSAPEISELPLLAIAPGVYVILIESQHSRMTEKLVIYR